MDNPFRIEGVVRPPYFTDRDEELQRIEAALTRPASKLLVYGPRRMGKTSTITVAAERVRDQGSSVVLADFSTASSAADFVNRLMGAAGRTLGRRWRDLPGELASRLQVSLRLEADPATGVPVPVLDAQLRRRPVEQQHETLGRLLDTLERMARDRETHLALILDEFQEIHRFGGESAEWRLRGVVQHHEHTSYVLAGSKTHLIRQMVGKERAFYKLFDVLHFGPMDADHFAAWIDRRMEDGGRARPGLGARCVDVAGPRTRDVVQLARKCFDLTETGEGDDTESLVRRAFLEIVEEEDDLARMFWAQLTSHQQNVLRAVAAADRGLTAEETLQRFALGHSGTVSNTARALVGKGYLVRVHRAPGYEFDSPFLRGWVVENTLADLGMRADPLRGPTV